jgi:hypothetical protein
VSWKESRFILAYPCSDTQFSLALVEELEDSLLVANAARLKKL